MANKEICRAWVITETHQGREVEVFCAFNRRQAERMMESMYCEDDLEGLSPCLYYRKADGSLTTEY